MNMVSVVVLASPPIDPMQAPQCVALLSVVHMQRNDSPSSSIQQGAVEWYMGSAAQRRDAYGGEFLRAGLRLCARDGKDRQNN
jgi:hypothetical protein